MKKLAIAAAAAAALTAGTAQAYTVGSFSNGFVVPNVIHNGATNSTAVGVISTKAAAVHWTFFDQNSIHVTDNCFEMTANDYQSFVWANESGEGLAGKRGYLVFTTSATSAGTALETKCKGGSKVVPQTSTAFDAISGHAFEYDLASKDVAFVPVVDGPLTISGPTTDAMGPTSLQAVGGAVPVDGSANTLYLRYYIDGKAGGDDTRIVIWSTGSHKTAGVPVNMYNSAQDAKSVTLVLPNTELDFIDPETIAGRPAGYTDGFITWNPALTTESGTAGSNSGSVFSYSVISAPAFGAIQTILNPSVYRAIP